MSSKVILTGEDLSIEDTVRVARHNQAVGLSDNPEILKRIEASCKYINQAVKSHQPVYGVTTGFGGMANVIISPEEAADLQNNAIWYHKTGAGKLLPIPDVRAAMLLRANSHMRGVSGIRLEIIQRMVTFLNAGVTPHVREFGSIGASGDLVPLISITGALMGTDPSFMVNFNGEDIDCLTALERLNLPRMRLLPKEGLAMMNGTSVMTGIAANCVHDARILLALALEVHALMIQALQGTNQSFHPFIHQHKPHTGQVWVANHMRELLNGSTLSRDELDGSHDYRDGDLIQDRYSLRCLPQFLGPIIDGLAYISHHLRVEINSANDNPLIDTANEASYHGGNFLGQYIGVGMDQLRYYMGLLAKHIDVQIALLVSPQFSNGLSPSLVGNTERKVNMGLKGLQISGNSIMPILGFLGNSLADRFPTHAEQFNQNINSQGFGSANLARQTIETLQQYMAIALIFGVQAVDLRTHKLAGHYNAFEHLSPMTANMYSAVRTVVGRTPSRERPYIWNDDEQSLEQHISDIVKDIASDGIISQSVEQTLRSLRSIILFR
ncbi:MAG: aromatic amino acid lyase [Herpetosiphonaceae bacterium]|nr:aromatic amino acid lyase [Herpetosiphonaceae bacterium]